MFSFFPCDNPGGKMKLNYKSNKAWSFCVVLHEDVWRHRPECGQNIYPDQARVHMYPNVCTDSFSEQREELISIVFICAELSAFKAEDAFVEKTNRGWVGGFSLYAFI